MHTLPCVSLEILIVKDVKRGKLPLTWPETELLNHPLLLGRH